LRFIATKFGERRFSTSKSNNQPTSTITPTALTMPPATRANNGWVVSVPSELGKAMSLLREELEELMHHNATRAGATAITKESRARSAQA
jgi:hypothetical protein